MRLLDHLGSDSTYEGLKQGLEGPMVLAIGRGSDSTYEGLKRASVFLRSAMLAGSDSTYEGLKLGGSIVPDLINGMFRQYL